MKSDMNEYKEKFNKFKSTKEGKKLIMAFFIGVLVGILWKIIFIALVAMGVGYGLYVIVKRGSKNESKGKAEV